MQMYFLQRYFLQFVYNACACCNPICPYWDIIKLKWSEVKWTTSITVFFWRLCWPPPPGHVVSKPISSCSVYNQLHVPLTCGFLFSNLQLLTPCVSEFFHVCLYPTQVVHFRGQFFSVFRSCLICLLVGELLDCCQDVCAAVTTVTIAVTLSLLPFVDRFEESRQVGEKVNLPCPLGYLS